MYLIKINWMQTKTKLITDPKKIKCIVENTILPTLHPEVKFKHHIFVIPEIPPSGNQSHRTVLTLEGRSQRVKTTEYASWLDRMFVHVPSINLETAILYLTFIFQNKIKRDYDNFEKSLMDLLKSQKNKGITSFLKDDSVFNLPLVLKSYGICRANPRIVVQAWEAIEGVSDKSIKKLPKRRRKIHGQKI